MINQLHKGWNQEIKSIFTDCLLKYEGAVFLENFTDKLMDYLIDLLNVDQAACYFTDPWKQILYLQKATSNNKDKLNFDIHISLDEINTMDFRSYHNLIYQDHLPCISIPCTDQGSLFGLLVLHSKKKVEMADDQELESFSYEIVELLKKAKDIAERKKEEERYKLLQKVTAKFHSSMNIQSVLAEVIETLQRVFPTFIYYLLMSLDNDTNLDLPIKDLELDGENLSAMQAYVSGKVQYENSIEYRKTILYAPLLGKQGVYGVLQVIAPDTVFFPETEVEFISLLANTAGSAIENAQLYEQSKRLIADLQLINETSHRLNSNLRLSETISYMREQITKSFSVEEVGFFMIGHNQIPKLVPGSSPFFHEPASAPYVEYVMANIMRDGEPLLIGDLHISVMEQKVYYKSLIAVPMVQSGRLEGFSVVVHRAPYHFTFEMFKLLQSLIHHSSLAFTNSMLREELEKMVITDYLTGLYSRNYLEEQMQIYMQDNLQGTFILIDIDDFKQINDNFGHQIGDDILIQVAELIKHSIRETDIGTRWGGEELAIFLPHTNLKAGHSVAERLVEKVSTHTSPKVTISCGLSYWENSCKENMADLFKRADDALYSAKRSGKNKVVIQNTKG